MATGEPKSVYEQTKAAADAAYNEFETARHAFNEKWKANVEESATSVINNVSEKFGEAVHKADEYAAGTVSSAYECTKNTVGAVVHGAKEAAQGLLDSEPGKAAKHAVHVASETISEMTK